MLSFPGKLFESQACDAIVNHLRTNNPLSNKQWGFNKGRSTEELLLQLSEKWKKAMDKGLIIGATFLDFQKAFDSVSEAITEGEATIFADDTSIYYIGDNVDKIIDSLNLAMKQVHNWCRRNKLTVHQEKTEAMLLTNKAFMGPLKPIMYGESYISIVNSVKYLGITIDSKLNWDKHI